MSDSKHEVDALLSVLEALSPIAEQHGIEVHLSRQPQKEEIFPADFAKLQIQRRNDFFWFDSQLKQHPDLRNKYIGSYVVVHKEHVVSFSSNRDLAVHAFLYARSRALLVEALVIPVCVSDPDGNEEWQNLLCSLGF